MAALGLVDMPEEIQECVFSHFVFAYDWFTLMRLLYAAMRKPGHCNRALLRIATGPMVMSTHWVRHVPMVSTMWPPNYTFAVKYGKSGEITWSAYRWFLQRAVRQGRFLTTHLGYAASTPVDVYTAQACRAALNSLNARKTRRKMDWPEKAAAWKDTRTWGIHAVCPPPGRLRGSITALHHRRYQEMYFGEVVQPVSVLEAASSRPYSAEDGLFYINIRKFLSWIILTRHERKQAVYRRRVSEMQPADAVVSV